MPSRQEQERSIEIGAPIGKCYETICDFKAYPTWQSNVKKVKIVKKGKDGRPKVVEFTVSVLGREVRYVLDYSYDDEKAVLTWEYVEGDIKDTSGSYVFVKKGSKKTIATYSLNVDLGFWVPQVILNTLTKIGMIDTMQALKEYIEEA